MTKRRWHHDWLTSDAIVAAECGNYLIVVKPFWVDNKPYYSVYHAGTGQKVPCITRAQEKRFPKRAAKLATELVKLIQNQ